MTFKDLGLKESILESISKLGFETPSPIQEQVIPYLLNNESDIVGLAQTGTGKTAAFGLPLIHLAEAKDKFIQGLVLAPTRELCVQIVGLQCKALRSGLINDKIGNILILLLQ